MIKCPLPYFVIIVIKYNERPLFTVRKDIKRLKKSVKKNP